MKVLFCDNNLKLFWIFRKDVVYHLHDKGFEIGIVIPESTFTKKQRAKLPTYAKVHKVKMNPNSSNPLGDVIFFMKLVNIFFREKPELVINYTIKPNIYGALAARLSGSKCIDMVAGLGYVFNGGGIKKRIAQMLYRFGLKKAHKVITLNESNAKLLVDQHFVDSENLRWFKSGEGVNLEDFPYAENHFEKPRFMMVGRVLRDKGYEEFVEAAGIVKETHPDCIFEWLGPLGGDSPMAVPEEQVRHDADNHVIEYLGETDNVVPFLQRPGVVVIMSSYHEGLNRSLMEACATGRPCIATDIPGCKETIDNEINGYLVEVKSGEAIADAVNRFLCLSEEDKRHMAEKSYEKAKTEFDVNLVLKEYDELIDELIGELQN